MWNFEEISANRNLPLNMFQGTSISFYIPERRKTRINWFLGFHSFSYTLLRVLDNHKKKKETSTIYFQFSPIHGSLNSLKGPRKNKVKPRTLAHRKKPLHVFNIFLINLSSFLAKSPNHRAYQRNFRRRVRRNKHITAQVMCEVFFIEINIKIETLVYSYNL